jgi:predicted nucleic acid-binding protein
MTIVDASVATAWFVSIATSKQAGPVRLHRTLSAPSLLKVELTNSLLKYVRAGLLPADDVFPAIRQAEMLIENWTDDADLLNDATAVAIANRHKIYDCIYLALALRRREPLATADRRLSVLARTLGSEVLLVGPEL